MESNHKIGLSDGSYAQKNILLNKEQLDYWDTTSFEHLGVNVIKDFRFSNPFFFSELKFTIL